MIHCVPRWLSATYDISGYGLSAFVSFNWLSEQGVIGIAGEHYEVDKHGAFSGRWSMISNSEEIAIAQKGSPFSRTISLDSRVGPITLKARSMLGRTMLLFGSGFDAVIAPNHIFSRRYTIVGSIPNFEVACFAFWLARMLQRRQKNSN